MTRSRKLPDEILIYVFSLLSFRDVLHCAQVNKRWNRLCGNKLWKILYQNQEKISLNFRCEMANLEDKDIRELEDLNPSFWRENFTYAWRESLRPLVLPVQWKGMTLINRMRKVTVSKSPTLGGDKKKNIVCMRNDEEGWLFSANTVGVPISQHPKTKLWFDEPPTCPVCHRKELNVIFTFGTASYHSFHVDLELKCIPCNHYLVCTFNE